MRHTTHRRVRRQVHSLRTQFAQVAGLPFADVLSADLSAAVLADAQVTFRDRVYAPLKEFWAHLLAYHLIRTTMAQAAHAHGCDPRRLSFTGALQTLRAFALPLLLCPADQLPDLVRRLLAAVAHHRVGDRPDRVEPRARKRRPKHDQNLTRPRAQARKLETRKRSG